MAVLHSQGNGEKETDPLKTVSIVALDPLLSPLKWSVDPKVEERRQLANVLMDMR